MCAQEMLAETLRTPFRYCCYWDTGCVCTDNSVWSAYSLNTRHQILFYFEVLYDSFYDPIRTAHNVKIIFQVTGTHQSGALAAHKTRRACLKRMLQPSINDAVAHGFILQR